VLRCYLVIIQYRYVHFCTHLQEGVGGLTASLAGTGLRRAACANQTDIPGLHQPGMLQCHTCCEMTNTFLLIDRCSPSWCMPIQMVQGLRETPPLSILSNGLQALSHEQQANKRPKLQGKCRAIKTHMCMQLRTLLLPDGVMVGRQPP
jgi:hypothetical protein